MIDSIHGNLVAQMMGRVNKDRLGQYLGEIQRKENTEDRYSAALRGETLTGAPGARVRGGAGASTSAAPSSSSQPEKVVVPLQTEPGASKSKAAAPTTSFTT